VHREGRNGGALEERRGYLVQVSLLFAHTRRPLADRRRGLRDAALTPGPGWPGSARAWRQGASTPQPGPAQASQMQERARSRSVTNSGGTGVSWADLLVTRHGVPELGQAACRGRNAGLLKGTA